MSRRGERGQATVFIIGLVVVLLMAIAVVVDASAAFLQRQQLHTVADGAALAGADAGSRNVDALYGEGIDAAGRLDQAEAVARAAVADHLRRTGAHAAYPGLAVEVRFDHDQDAVIVSLRATLDLPLTLPGSADHAVIGAVGTAVVEVRPAA